MEAYAVNSLSWIFLGLNPKGVHLLCCVHVKEAERVQQLMNNFASLTRLLVNIHQLFPGVLHSDFRAAARTLDDENIIFVVRRPRGELNAWNVRDVIHRCVDGRDEFWACEGINWVSYCSILAFFSLPLDEFFFECKSSEKPENEWT